MTMPSHHWRCLTRRQHLCTRCGLQRRTVGPLWWPRHIYTDTSWHGIPMQVSNAPGCVSVTK
jgi:hypothetical protein